MLCDYDSSLSFTKFATPNAIGIAATTPLPIFSKILFRLFFFSSFSLAILPQQSKQ